MCLSIRPTTMGRQACRAQLLAWRKALLAATTSICWCLQVGTLITSLHSLSAYMHCLLVFSKPFDFSIYHAEHVAIKSLQIILTLAGQFGTRLQGGKDAASARYIFTRLEKITRTVFHESDDKLLDYLNEEGQSIEPRWYRFCKTCNKLL